MIVNAKVLGTEWFQEDSNGYGMTPWTTRMYVVFAHDGKRGSARIDFVLRQWLGHMTGERRKLIHDTRPETISVFPKKYKNAYGRMVTSYVVRKGELDEWGKRAKALLPPPPEPKVRVEPVVEQEPAFRTDGKYRLAEDGTWEFVEYKEGENIPRRPPLAVGPPYPRS